MGESLSQVLVVMVFGFPAVFMSLLFSVIGILKEKFWLGVIGAIFLIPFSYYLNGAPGSGGVVILLPLFQTGSAVAVRKKNKLWAWLLLIPAFLASLWVLGVSLFYQIRP
jgi:hypothetical protein